MKNLKYCNNYQIVTQKIKGKNTIGKIVLIDLFSAGLSQTFNL